MATKQIKTLWAWFLLCLVALPGIQTADAKSSASAATLIDEKVQGNNCLLNNVGAFQSEGLTIDNGAIISLKDGNVEVALLEVPYADYNVYQNGKHVAVVHYNNPNAENYFPSDAPWGRCTMDLVSQTKGNDQAPLTGQAASTPENDWTGLIPEGTQALTSYVHPGYAFFIQDGVIQRAHLRTKTVTPQYGDNNFLMRATVTDMKMYGPWLILRFVSESGNEYHVVSWLNVGPEIGNLRHIPGMDDSLNAEFTGVALASGDNALLELTLADNTVCYITTSGRAVENYSPCPGWQETDA